MLIAAIALVTFAAAPHVDAAPSVRCAPCTLLAQAETAPPLPGEQPNVQQAPAPRTADELQSRIDALNREIRSIDINPSPGYIILGYAGYVVAPTGLLMGGALLFFGLFASSLGIPQAGSIIALTIGLGVVGLALGVAGIIAIVYAVTAGTASVADKRKHRDELIEERIRLEEQLRQMRRPTSVMAPVMVTLVTF